MEPIHLHKKKEACLKDLGAHLTNEGWRSCISPKHTSSFVQHSLIQLKVLFPEVDSPCPRCGHRLPKVGKMFWTFSSLNNYRGLSCLSRVFYPHAEHH